MPEPDAGQPRRLAGGASLHHGARDRPSAARGRVVAPHRSDAELEDEPSIGGDLPLIMPDEEPASTTPDALADIPLMDLSLPTPGEAMGASTRRPRPDASVDRLPRARRLGSCRRARRRPALRRRRFSQTGDDEAISGVPTPPAARPSHTIEAEHSVELLQALVDERAGRSLQAPAARRGDARVGRPRRRSAGARDGDGRLRARRRAASAASVADEIVRLNPESVRHHQKRVEYAFRTNERGRLIEAYLALADALFRNGQVEKSRAIYHRVIDLAPDDLRAQAALENFAEDEPEPEPPPPPPPKRARPTSRRRAARARRARCSPVPDDEFVNLGDWLRDDEAPKDTRMVVDGEGADRRRGSGLPGHAPEVQAGHRRERRGRGSPEPLRPRRRVQGDGPARRGDRRVPEGAARADQSRAHVRGARASASSRRSSSRWRRRSSAARSTRRA